MAHFNWQILEVLSSNNTLDCVKYFVTATEGQNQVTTEGYAKFDLPAEVNFSNLIEVELLEYLKRFYIQDGVNTIELNLIKQLEYLSKNTTTIPPWHVETFKVEV